MASRQRVGDACSHLSGWFDVHVIDGLVNACGYAGEVLARLTGVIDRVVVDGFVNMWWHLSHALSRKFRRLQTGNVQDYLAFAIGGIILISITVLFLGS